MSEENSPVLGPQPTSGSMAYIPPMSYGRVAQDIGANQDFPMVRKPKKPAAKKAPATNEAAKTAAAAPAAAPKPKPAKKVKPAAPSKKEQKKKAVTEDDEDTAPEPVTAAPPKSGFGIVKEVVSGDTIVVVGAASAGSSLLPERTITLSGVIAPKLARGRQGGADEAFAWEAREFLRRRLIGQQVYFVVNHRAESDESKGAPREYGSVQFQGEDLANSLLSVGLVTVKPPKDASKPVPEERKKLLEIEAKARAAGLGLHTTDARIQTAKVRLINWEPDARALFDKMRGHALPAIVDQVRDGSTLRCELLGERGVLSHVMITLYLAGVRSPNVPLSDEVLKRIRGGEKKRGDDDDEDRQDSRNKLEPLGKEAQQFTEMRLLNREVEVVLQGVDAFGHFFGTVRYTKGNISLLLLQKGLGRLVPWSAALTSDADKYIQAETDAKSQQVGVWEEYDASEDKEEKVADPSKAISVRIVAVHSGDTISVVDEKGIESKHPLASIRCPRMGNARRDEPAQPWGWEAREYVRQTLIGRTVDLLEEYTRELRPNTGGKGKNKVVEVQRYVTVFYNKENISEQLVLRGLASVIRHRPEEPRSIYYDVLQSAEVKAIEAKKGQQGKGVPQRVHDYSVSADQDRKKQLDASVHVTELKAKPFNAVVEYVSSGSRVKLYVPSRGILITFLLDGIAVPRPSDEGKGSLGDQAASFVRELVYQHTVVATATGQDKAGAFIGQLEINGVSLAVRLLERGLGTVFRGPADQIRPAWAAAFDAAEQRAKDGKVGWWLDHDAGAAPEDDEKKLYTVRVTDITDAIHFSVQVVGDANVAAVEEKMKAFNEEAKDAPEDFKVEVSQIVAGRWAAEGDEESAAYYRVKIEKPIGGDKYKVHFVDYGNSDVLEFAALRPLPEAVASLPQCARQCQLAGVMLPPRQWGEQAAYAFNDFAMGKELLARQELARDEQWLVTLMTESTNVSINAQLVQNGFVKLQKKPPRKLFSLVQEMIPFKHEAVKNQAGCYEDGESDDERDEDDEDRRRAAKRQGASSGGRRRGVGGGKGSDRAPLAAHKAGPPAKGGAAAAAPAGDAKKEAKKEAKKDAAPAKGAAPAAAPAAKKGKGK